MKKGWQTKRLGEVCAFDKAQGIHRDLPYVGLENIEPHTARFIGSTDPQPMKSTTFRFSSQHVLYGRLRPYLNKVLAPDFEGHCSTEIFPIKPRPGLSREYLLYWLLADETVARINATSTGARMPRADMKEVLGFDFPLPPLPEQQRIVGLLDDAFESIATAKANAEKNLQNARALFESRLQSVFIQRGKGWVEKPLGDVCDLLNGFAFKSGDAVQASQTQLVRMGNLYSNRLNLARSPIFYPDSFSAEYRRYLLNEGDLIMSLTGTTGKEDYGYAVRIPESSNALLMNQRIAKFDSLNEKLVDQDFVYYYLRSRAFLDILYPTANGTRQANLSSVTIKTLPIPLCPVGKQKAIASALDEITEETQRLESIYQRKLAALGELKKSLLSKAFAGELTLQSRESVVISFPTTIRDISTTDLHAGVLAMSCQLHEQSGKLQHFTHVKAEKIAHMVEARLGINLDRTPIKDAAGPNDFPHLLKVEHRARKTKCFDFKQVEGGAYKVHKLTGFERLIERTRVALGDRCAQVDQLLQWMLPMNVKQAEIVATVFAAWNNLLLDDKHPSDEQIVFESRENWHPNKLKIDREKFFSAVQWLKEQGMVPEGKGRRVEGKRK